MSNAHHTFNNINLSNGSNPLLISLTTSVTLPKIESEHFTNSKNVLKKEKKILSTETFKNLLSENDLLKTVLCLYEKEFKPVYADIICPCPSCYNRPLWNKIVYLSSQINKFSIWNDIIKRWESSSQIKDNHSEFSNFSNQVKNNIKTFSILTMEEIYDTEKRKFTFNNYLGYCDDCPPQTFSPKGKATIQKYFKNPINVNDNNCSLCQIYEPKLAIRAFSNISKRMEIISSNILATDSFMFELKNDIEYSAIFDILLEIPEHQYENIFECQGKRFMTQQLLYPESSLGGYAKLTEISSFGTFTGIINVEYTNIDNSNEKFTCSYPWKIIIKPLSNPPKVNTN